MRVPGFRLHEHARHPHGGGLSERGVTEPVPWSERVLLAGVDFGPALRPAFALPNGWQESGRRLRASVSEAVLAAAGVF